VVAEGRERVAFLQGLRLKKAGSCSETKLGSFARSTYLMMALFRFVREKLSQLNSHQAFF
jgi:hypothetical protein